MAGIQRDIDLIINVGGVLTHWIGVEEGGGELVKYESGPVGGPSTFDYDSTGAMRTRMTYDVKTQIPFAIKADAEEFRALFAIGKHFDAKAAPSGDDEMFITGRPEQIGKRFVSVKIPTASYARTAQNSTDGAVVEISIMLEESGPTPAP